MRIHDDEMDYDETDDDDTGDELTIGIAAAFRTLPLLDQHYLHMQAMNLDLIDRFLISCETDLIREYLQTERTPPSTMFVSALGQLWLFGLYELLRTWRQRAQDILRWHKEFQALPPGAQSARIAAKKRDIEQKVAGFPGMSGLYWPAYEQAARDPLFIEALRKAFDRTERLFHRIEAFRIALAKHEVPRESGSFAMAPGYGRIDMTDGSIYWEIALGRDEYDVLSRRAIAIQCRRLSRNDPLVILPEPIQKKIREFPSFRYGGKRVTVILDDGDRYPGVRVAWNKEVMCVDGYDTIPFDAERIVDAQHDPGDENDAAS